MINPNLVPIFSSDIIYDGGAIGAVPIPANATLNDIFTNIGTYISTLTPTTILDSDNITLAVNCVGTGSIIGDTLSVFFGDLTSTLAAIDLSPYLLKSAYDANTILYATTDNTPVALTVGASTFVGRKASGNIVAMTVAEAITLHGTTNVDANCVFPYNTALPFAVGAETGADKVLIAVKESGIFANNPYLAYTHSVLGAAESMCYVGKAATSIYYKILASEGDTGFYALTSGATCATKIQQIVLADRVSGVDPHYYWYIRKDGGDSSHLKIGYYNGAVENEYLQINKTTGGFLFNNTVEIIGILDEDTMVSDSAVHVSTQQSLKAYVDTTTASQTEMDTTQTGAGLNADGTYTADPASNYITGATDLKDADTLLDAQIKIINDKSDQSLITAGKHVQAAYGEFTYSQQPTTGTFSINLTTNIPDNAIITYARVDVLTVFTDDGTNIATIGIGIETVGAGTEDIKNASAIGTDYTLGLKADTWMDYLPATPYKLTAARDMTVNVVLGGAATTLSTGKLAVYVQYFVTE